MSDSNIFTPISIEIVEAARNPLTDNMAHLLFLLRPLSYTFLLFAKAFLLAKILTKRDCTGISGKSQILYTLVFAARYLDLASSYQVIYWVYSLPKICLLILSYSIVLSIYFFFTSSYQSHHDKFRIEHLILPSIVLSLLANYGVEINDVFWAFSVYLEAMAIIPQLYFCSKAKKVQNPVYNYIVLMTLYKLCHVFNEMYNHFDMNMHFDRISLAAGVIQLMFYLDFFAFEEEQVQVDDAATADKTINDVPIVFVHPKEAEAMGSETKSEAARIAKDRQMFAYVYDQDRSIPCSQQLSNRLNENKASELPVTTEQEENKTQVNLTTPDLTTHSKIHLEQ